MYPVTRDPAAAYERIVSRVVGWAEDEPRIRTAMVAGSRARIDHPADAWSDLDVVIFATDPDALLAEDDWIHRMGTPLITFLEPTAVGMWKERRALFEGALDADFSIIPAAFLPEALAHPSLVRDVASVILRGVRILVDKDGQLGRLVASVADLPRAGAEPPDQFRLGQVINDFWYHTIWIAKKLRRGELAVAHECLDGHQRLLLLTLVRWHAELRGSIWHGTRYLEEWVDGTTLDALATTWARHDAADVVRATRAMMDLVSRLSAEIAAAHGLATPAQAEPAGRAWFDAITAPFDPSSRAAEA